MLYYLGLGIGNRMGKPIIFLDRKGNVGGEELVIIPNSAMKLYKS